MQCAFVVYHGVSHLSLGFSWYAHTRVKALVYSDKTIQDVPWYTMLHNYIQHTGSFQFHSSHGFPGEKNSE